MPTWFLLLELRPLEPGHLRIEASANDGFHQLGVLRVEVEGGVFWILRRDEAQALKRKNVDTKMRLKEWTKISLQREIGQI